MRAKKTIEINYLKDKINALLALPHLSQDEKRAYCFILADALMQTGNYNGYNNIKWIKGDGWKLWKADGQPDYTNNEENRAKYFGPEFDRFYF
jgi:hypothetical protein